MLLQDIARHSSNLIKFCFHAAMGHDSWVCSPVRSPGIGLCLVHGSATPRDIGSHQEIGDLSHLSYFIPDEIPREGLGDAFCVYRMGPQGQPLTFWQAVRFNASLFSYKMAGQARYLLQNGYICFS